MPDTPVVDKPDKTGQQDPSPLVIQMVQREVAQLQELRVSELEGLRREITTRLDAMDKALAKVEEYPTAVDLAVARAREYFDEKFRSIEVRFNERDKRFRDRDEASKAMVDEQRTSSALAIDKAEASMRQQLEAQMKQISAVERRMDRSEGKTEGAVRLWGTIVAGFIVLGVIVSIATVFMTRVPAA